MSVREKQSIVGTLNADKKQSIVGNIGIADVLIREGEYYVPNVSQVDEDTIVLSLTPSKDFMETVSDQEITLPRGRTGEPGKDGQDGQDGKDGKDGNDYVLTDTDKNDIAGQAASLIDIPDVSGMVTSINGVKADENGNVEIVPGVQSDWNQNDITAIDYVKNRTHWEESNLTNVINKTTVTVAKNSKYVKITDSCPMLTTGKTYIVVLNNITYHCVARTYGSAVLLGNGKIFGDGVSSNNEPFAIDSYSSGTVYLNVETPGTYTISIQTYVTSIHTIDPKYLPESVKQVYTLPIATDSELGGVKSGGHVLVNENGTMSLAEDLLSDVIHAPSTANPGQVLVVKSVDSNNKPTEWEVTDAPTGSGGGSGIVVSDTAPENTDVLWVDTDDNEADNLQEAINTALAQAKASGEFKGEPGDDYVLTEADKQEIAGMVEVQGGGSVKLDTTLTVSGNAADAKAVGDALKAKLDKSGGTMTGKIVFPTGDQNAGFANSEDMKIFGYGAIDGTVHMRMGDTQYPFQIRGNGDRPKYNNSMIALTGDIPTDDHINDLINTALGVIENGTY